MPLTRRQRIRPQTCSRHKFRRRFDLLGTDGDGYVGERDFTALADAPPAPRPR